MIPTFRRWKLGLLLILASMGVVLLTYTAVMVLRVELNALGIKVAQVEALLDESFVRKDLPRIKENGDRLEDLVNEMRRCAVGVFAATIITLIAFPFFVWGTILITSEPESFWERACRWSLIILPACKVASIAGTTPTLLWFCTTFLLYPIGAGQGAALTKIAHRIGEPSICQKIEFAERMFMWIGCAFIIGVLGLNLTLRLEPWARVSLMGILIATACWLTAVTAYSQIQLYIHLRNITDSNNRTV